jgi:hypothetical protein
LLPQGIKPGRPADAVQSMRAARIGTTGSRRAADLDGGTVGVMARVLPVRIEEPASGDRTRPLL